MAEELGVFHPGHHRCVQDERVSLPEQHGYPQASLRGGLRLQLRADDADQGQASQGYYVQSILRRVPGIHDHLISFSSQSTLSEG